MRLDPLPWLGLRLGYRGAMPLRGRTAEATLRLQSHAVELGALGTWRRGRIGLGGGLSVLGDVTLRRVYVVDPTWKVGADRGDLLWWVVPRVRLDVRVVGRWGLFLELAGQIALNPKRYLLQDGEDSQILLAPWPVQPAALVGVSVKVR